MARQARRIKQVGSDPAMSLVRIALISFEPAPKSGNHFHVDFGDVTIDTMGSAQTANGVEIVIAAAVRLEHWPKVTSDHLVVVPSKPRERLERSLETMANMIAALDRVRRTLTSPTPCVAFEPHDDEAKAWLAAKKGIHGQTSLVDLTFNYARIPLANPAVGAALVDRFDGVALLAEVASQTHALGQYRDLIRFLERAFRLPASQLAEPLARALDPRFGVTVKEVTQWLAVRDPATHADVRRRFALESDARPYLQRMLQAATDVLLNKEEWNDPSEGRSDRWPLQIWTVSPDGAAKALIGTEGSIGATMLDPFAVFLCDFRNVKVPEQYWAPPIPTYGTPERSFEVLPADHPDVRHPRAGS